MTKITLQDLTSLTNEQSAINLINNNNTVIENKSDTFLSRDGTSPNQMLADLDMNSKRILNLPTPVDDTEPLRKKDVPGVEDIGDINQSVDQAQQAAAVATAAAISASNSASNAATNVDKLKGTSTTSLGISLGPKVFITQANKFFDEGIWLLITSDANEANYMHGRSTGYAGSTLNFLVTNIGGTGTFSDWTIRVSGTQGAAGSPGAQGPQGIPGITGGSFFPVARAVATTHVNTGSGGGLEPGDTIDGVTLAAGDVVLLSNQNTTAQNGLYTVPASGAAGRTTNYTTFNSLAGCYISVMEGTNYFDTLWFCSSNPNGVIEVDPIVIQQYALGRNYTVNEKNILTSIIGFTNASPAVTAQATTSLDDVSGWNVDIAGTTGINQITLSAGRTRTVRFINPLILANNANLILPGGTNINVLAGDVATFQGYAGGIVRCLNYERADGTTLKIGGSLDTVDGNAGTKGAMLYRDTTTWSSILPPSSSGNQRVLTSTGTGTNPAWAQVDVSQAVGNLSTARLNGGSGATSSTFWRGDGSWSTPSGAGNVVGPASSVDNNIATYDLTTGKVIKDSTYTLTSTSIGRFPTGFDFNDTNGNELLTFSSTPSAVNEVTMFNGAAGGRCGILASGNDTNIEMQVGGKGNLGVIIQGTAAGNTAPAGYVGEIKTGGSSAGMTSDTQINCGNIQLTPGDWDVWGSVYFYGNPPHVAINYFLACLHTASPTVANNSTLGANAFASMYFSGGPTITAVLGQTQALTLHFGPIVVNNVTNPLTLFCNTQMGFAAGSGGIATVSTITARRKR